MSVPLPAEVGERSSIGFVGYDWPTAVPDRLAASAAAASSVRTPADFAMMVSSLVVSVVLCRRKYSRRPSRSMARALKQLRQIVQEAARRDAVHDAVVVGERNGEYPPHTPALRICFIHYHPRCGSPNAEYGGLSGSEHGRS